MSIRKALFVIASTGVLAVPTFAQKRDFQSGPPAPPPFVAHAKRLPRIPTHIAVSDVDRCAIILDLSLAQKKYLEAIHKQYLEQCEQIEQRLGPAFIAAAETVDQLCRPPVRYPDFNDAQFAMWRVEENLRAALEKEDKHLISELSLVLSEFQKTLLPRVEMRRQRQVCWKYTLHNRISRARLDLSQALEAGRISESVLAQLEPLLWEYEQAVTPLFVALDNENKEFRQKYAAICQNQAVDSNGQPWDLSKPEVAQQVNQMVAEELANLLRKPFDLQRQIASLNDEYLIKLMGKMPEAKADGLQQAYSSAAYRRVFPDPTDPKRLYEAIMSTEQITDELRIALTSQWSAYRMSYDALCKLMCQSTDRWQEFGARTGLDQGWQEHNTQMAKWTEERIDKNEGFVKHFCDSLPPEAMVDQKRLINDWKDSLKFAREVASKRSSPSSIDFN